MNALIFLSCIALCLYIFDRIIKGFIFYNILTGLIKSKKTNRKEKVDEEFDFLK